ncbi:MAG: bifunctional [glutamine synthetase] adenylyltransferase/[glutamine synthetase]-adenylyl-L-tyrosine phosphorylase [Alphaproteobacteria bacterium]|nr:bifunctional [glutamine synthetase] adenylyltransferase/[glutamine synthetase]-adenylyl-L-tyrosine phosphorylase [Alphaproteobacteria bacterium]
MVPADLPESPEWDRWEAAVADRQDPGLADFAGALKESAEGYALLAGVFHHSPHLSDLMVKEPETVRIVVEQGWAEAVQHAFSEFEVAAPTGEAARTDEDLAKTMTRIRVLKRRVALALGLGDILGTAPLLAITAALSRVAEESIDAALAPILRNLIRRKKLPERDPENPVEGCGVFVLGMGKLGARELNYSSDIDIIVLFDDAVSGLEDVGEVQPWIVRLTRELGRAMEERTKDGYVFRIDLRLRPDPGATPLAMCATVASTYYETIGQNWERAAMIKARVVGGDRQAGERFLAQIRSFVWRKNLDFWAIQDIHSIKRQIATHKGGHAFKAPGFDVKLGPGGIREIEFFAQVQQLIWGGREIRLRLPRTLDALTALRDLDHLAEPVRADLEAAYHFLRTVEHRLQMVNDQQTHKLPETPEGLEKIGQFLGYPDAGAFLADLEHHTATVHRHYTDLFGDAPSLGATTREGTGNLVFTGAEDDPDTIETLTEMGFAEPGRVTSMVRGWHHGRIRATRSERARQILTEILPALLDGFARTPDPDQTLIRFERFFGGLIAGVQFLSLLQMNPALSDSIARIFGSSPSLANQLSQSPNLIEALLAGSPPALENDLPTLQSDLDHTLARGRDHQDLLDLSRRWTNDQRFLAGLEVLEGRCHADRTGPYLTRVAEAVVSRITPAVIAEFAQRHGRFTLPEGGEAGPVLIALGKFGGFDLNAGSDLDMMVIYDAGTDGQSDGDKPLPATVYFVRLTQRLVSALTVQTGEGPLFDIDLRLRPSGQKSPLATSLDRMRQYYECEAWTWEYMALTRARIVYGPEPARDRVERALDAIRRMRHDPDKLLCDIESMRQRLVREKGAPLLSDLKQGRGGMVDVEFITQYLLLRHGPDLVDAKPRLFDGTIPDALSALAAQGKIDDAAARQLIDAYRLWQRLQGLLRLTHGEGKPLIDADASLRPLLAQAAEVESFDDVLAICTQQSENVMKTYAEVIGDPAEALLAGKIPESSSPAPAIEGELP